MTQKEVWTHLKHLIKTFKDRCGGARRKTVAKNKWTRGKADGARVEVNGVNGRRSVRKQPPRKTVHCDCGESPRLTTNRLWAQLGFDHLLLCVVPPQHRSRAPAHRRGHLLLLHNTQCCSCSVSPQSLFSSQPPKSLRALCTNFGNLTKIGTKSFRLLLAVLGFSNCLIVVGMSRKSARSNYPGHYQSGVMTVFLKNISLNHANEMRFKSDPRMIRNAIRVAFQEGD